MAKVRTGFVSNSSSSSFVVSTSKTDEEIYQDIEDFFKAFYKYRQFITGKDCDYYLTPPNLEKIKQRVDILHADKDGNIGDSFITSWYLEDHEQPADFFKNKIVIYGDDNFLPTDIDDFLWCRHLYSHDYVYYDGCTHMG